MNAHIFREYDIRGVAERDLDDATVRALGRAIAQRAGGPVVVGRDCRLSSPRLFSQLTDGIRAHAEVIDIGVVPTPVTYFAAHHLAPAAAVMITGSHNPPEDNGFKILIGTEALYGAAIAAPYKVSSPIITLKPLSSGGLWLPVIITAAFGCR